MIVRSDVLAHMERGARVGFLKGMRAYTPLRSAFVREVNSDGAFEIYADMGAVPWPRANAGQTPGTATDGRLGTPQVGGLHEGGPITVLGGNERSLTVFNRDWDIPIGITHNAINDGNANLEQWAQSAGQRFEQHKDYLCFNALNTGAASTYGLGYDGLVFFSASHADPGAQYTTAQSNTNASTLSLDNFNTVFISAASYLDDRGQPSGITPDLLIYAINLRVVAGNIISNREAMDTANREVNINAGQIRGLQAPGGWLDSTAWFIVASGMVEKPINLQIRQQPQLVFWDDHTQGSGVRYYKWTARYEVFYGDWRLCTMGNT